MKEPLGLFKQAPEKKNIPLFHQQSLFFLISYFVGLEKYSDFFRHCFIEFISAFHPLRQLFTENVCFSSLDKRMPLYHYVRWHFCQIAFLPPIASVLHTFRPSGCLWGSVHTQVFVGTASAGLLDS